MGSICFDLKGHFGIELIDVSKCELFCTETRK